MSSTDFLPKARWSYAIWYNMYLSFTDLITRAMNIYFFFLETHLKTVFKIIAFLVHLTR